jgi:tetratricopeptide (TPR) repeat protein
LPITRRHWLYLLQKDYARALGDYTEALKIEPNNAVFYRLRGDVYRTQKEHSKALADYGEAIRIAPRDAQANHNRALVYRALADQDFAAATRLNPNLKAP